MSENNNKNEKNSISLNDYLIRRQQMRYLPPAARLENVRSSHLILTGIVIMAGVLLALFLWAAFAKVEEIAISFGEVVPKGKVRVIQHVDGGIVTKVFVKEGDEVEKGQVLAQMDPVAATSELQQMQSRDASLTLTAKEMMESSRQGKIGNPDYLTELYKRQAEFMGQMEVLTKQLALQKNELAMYEQLIHQGYVSKRDYLAAQRAVNQTRGEISKLNTEHLQLKHMIQNLEHKVQRLTVASPVKGLAQDIQIHPGSVVQPGGELMSVVPLDDELIVETKISTRDIGHISVGDPAKVKVMTYDFSRYGWISGKLIQVSATTFTNPDGIPFYKGLIQLDRPYVGDDPNHRLLPGMTVQVDINTGSKSLLMYLLKPIRTAFASSFYER